MNLGGLVGRLRRAEKELAGRRVVAVNHNQAVAGNYPDDPVGYANHVLSVRLTPDQEAILKHLLIPPGWVNVPSANVTGKTFLAAVAISWWFDSFNPGCVYSVAPRYEHVANVMWGQVRILRYAAGLGGFSGTRAPEMHDGPDHIAIGITANKGESFRGRHIGRKLFVFEEATGLAPVYFDEVRTMYDPATRDAVLLIYNPTDPTSRMHQEDVRGQFADGEGDEKVFHRFPLSALNHPNILAEAEGKPAPFPGAVNSRMVTGWVRDWCEKVRRDDRTATDVEWPPGSGEWHRPGPEFQAKAQGLWPDEGTGVWSDPLWEACVKRRSAAFDTRILPQIGCDTATGKGDDYHAIHARWGDISIHHETANTMDPARIFGRLKAVAELSATKVNALRPGQAEPVKPRQVVVKIDDDGVGASLASFLRRDGYHLIQVGAGTRARREDRYPNKRSELWFDAAGRAKAGNLYLGELDRRTLQRLKQQAMAPAWDLDGQGRRVVESKDETKEKIGRSPDDMDAVNLAYYEPTPAAPKLVETGQAPAPRGAQVDYGGIDRRGGY